MLEWIAFIVGCTVFIVTMCIIIDNGKEYDDDE